MGKPGTGAPAGPGKGAAKSAAAAPGPLGMAPPMPPTPMAAPKPPGPPKPPAPLGNMSPELERVVNAFNPDQARDSTGRWSDSGGSEPPKGPQDEYSGSKVKQPHRELGDTDSFSQPAEETGLKGQTPSEMFPHLKHLLNGTEKVHGSGLTKKAATELAKKLRAKGTFAGVFKDPKTGKNIVVNQDMTLLLTLAAGMEAEEELAINGFDPDQPRDDEGRWAAAGGGSLADRVTRAIDQSSDPHPANRGVADRAVAEASDLSQPELYKLMDQVGLSGLGGAKPRDTKKAMLQRLHNRITATLRARERNEV